MILIYVSSLLMLSGLALYMSHQTVNQNSLVKVLSNGFMLFFVVSLTSLTFIWLYPEGYTRSFGMVLSLLYGPFIFFAMEQFRKGANLLRPSNIIHLFPFVFLLVLYVLSQNMPEGFLLKREKLNILLFISVFISCFSYSVYVLHLRKTIKNKVALPMKIIAGFAIMLFLYSVYVIVMMYLVFDQGQTSLMTELPFSGVLVEVGMVVGLFYLLFPPFLSGSYDVWRTEVNMEGEHFIEYTPEMEKMLPVELLKDYLPAFERLMYENEYYLHPEAGVDRIAQKLKIPGYQISFLINHVYKMGLPELLNRMRINHACQQIRENPESSMNTISKSAGFSSESSFYRNFKAYKNLTPSQYKQYVINKSL